MLAVLNGELLRTSEAQACPERPTEAEFRYGYGESDVGYSHLQASELKKICSPLCSLTQCQASSAIVVYNRRMPNETALPKPFSALAKHCEGVKPELILCGDPRYKDARLTPNERFDYKPHAIAMCECVEHVKWCIDCCRKNNIQFRVRSGGHHQEGMSSADCVLIIDLSRMKAVQYEPDGKHAWITPGWRLKDLGQELERHRVTIPVGICDSVFLGGLVAGGGWGLSNRRLGYTCDSVVAAEVVLANGEIVIATPGDEHHALLRAILGGGGGNFGVVTRFKFILHPLTDKLTTLKLAWHPEHTRAAAKKWARFQTRLDAEPALTLGGKISVAEDHGALLEMSGMYYGALEDAQRAIAELLGEPAPRYVVYEEVNRSFRPTAEGAGSSNSDDTPCTNLTSSLATFLNAPSSPRKDLKDGCNKRHAFKVSSAFPVFDPEAPHRLDALMDAVVSYIEGSSYDRYLFNFVSLLGCGGAAQRERNAHANGGVRLTSVPKTFRQRPFMLKFQAWWRPNHGTGKVDIFDAHQVSWIRQFRATLAEQGLIDGAFINFQDVTFVPNPDTIQGRLALLREYHKTELNCLIKVKRRVDPDNMFNSGMSLPSEPE